MLGLELYTIDTKLSKTDIISALVDLKVQLQTDESLDCIKSYKRRKQC